MKNFIEIGSCDFDTNLELIRTGNWSGILVEPVDTYFDNLKKEAMDMPHSENVILENVVISDYDGEIDFACVKPRSDWTRGISSVVDANHDYLKIDTEGHELNIIKSYSWKIKPTFIKLEHSHIDNLYCESLLKDLGYLVYREANDLYAII